MRRALGAGDRHDGTDGTDPPPSTPQRRSGPKPKRRTELGLIIFGCMLVAAAYVLATVGTTAKIPANLGVFLGDRPRARPRRSHSDTRISHRGERCHAAARRSFERPRLRDGRTDRPALRKTSGGMDRGGSRLYMLALVVVKRSRDLDRYRYLLLFSPAAHCFLSPSSPTSARTSTGLGYGSTSGR